MDTTKLASFIAATEAGSLSVAARRLSAQLSTISRHISEVEETIGAELLVRTGRGVRPTPAGEKFLERARHILREIEAASAEARGEHAPVLTHLRLSAPLDLSLQVMPKLIAALLRRHPGLSINTQSEARQVSLVEEDYNAAIRLGPLHDSGLIAHRVGSFPMLLCARPPIAAALRTIRELINKDFVLVGRRRALRLLHRGHETILQPKGRCQVGSFFEAAELAATTDSLVLLPSGTAAPLLASKRLAWVLPRLVLPRVEINLVHTPQHRGSLVLQELAELLTQELDRIEQSFEALSPKPVKRPAIRRGGR
jgi:DNA-binding transcriptional LysR family regulator